MKGYGSLLRIALWSVIFALVMSCATGGVTGWDEPIADPSIVPMVARFGDHRAFRNRTPERRPDEFRFVWVGGSSSLIHREDGKPPPDRMPRRVALELKGTRVPDPVGYDYVMQSIRCFDEYLALLDGLTRDPDAIVLSFHPGWAINPKTSFFRRYMIPAAIRRMLPDAPGLGILMGFSEPADWLVAAFAPWFAPLADQIEWHRALTTPLRGLHPLSQKGSELAALLEAREAAQRKSTSDHTGVQLAAIREHYEKVSPRLIEALAIDGDGWEGHHSVNWRVIHAILSALERHGVPTLIFIAPLREADRKQYGPRIALLREALEAAMRAHPGARVRYVPEIPDDAREGLRFRDYIHLEDPIKGPPGSGSFPAFVAAQLLELMVEADAGKGDSS